jgi:hypothetical protein
MKKHAEPIAKPKAIRRSQWALASGLWATANP